MLLGARTGHATVPYELRYVQSADKCPSSEALGAEVAARLGHPSDSDVPSKRVIVSMVRSKRGNGYLATIQIEEHGKIVGERELESNRCDELGTSVALAVALAIDPTGTGRSDGPREKDAPVQEPPEQRPPPVSANVGAAPEAPRSNPIVPFAEIEGGFATGVVPSGAFAFGAGAGLRVRSLSFALDGRFVLSGEHDSPFGTSLGSLISGGLRACVEPALTTRVRLPICMLVRGGAFFADARNVSRNEPNTTGYAAVGARAGLDWTFGAVSVTPYAEPLVPITQTHIRIVSNGVPRTLWTSPTVGLVVGLGLRVALD